MSWYSNIMNRLSSSAKLRALHTLNHLAVIIALFQFEFWILPVGFVIWYVIATFGISIGYHRYLSHKSFTTSKAWRRFFLGIGVFATGGSPLSWVGAHRLHHLYVDTPKDPHSMAILPKWRVYTHLWNSVVIPRGIIKDLLKSPDVLWLHRNYFLILFFWASLWYLIDWRLGVAIYSLPSVFAFHAFGLINVFGHSHGSRRFKLSDSSTNSWIANLLTAGEGWHNNHHRFPNCYRIGLSAREFDISAWILERLPIITNIQKTKKVLKHVTAVCAEADMKLSEN